MEVRVFSDAPAAARAAADAIAAAARTATAERGRFVLAVSGGSTPRVMFRALGDEVLPWADVWVVQVDERAAPREHSDRNLTHLRANLLQRVPIPPGQWLPMPVENPALDAAARQYAEALERIAGVPPILDLVHLGLGADGHTASLVPGDPVLAVTDRDVAATGEYQGWRRLTLTFPILNRARTILWLVTGADKAAALGRLRAADPAIPAGRVRQDRALVLADRAAAGS